MHHEVDPFSGKNAFESGGIGEIGLAEFYAGRDSTPVTVHEIIEHHGLMPRGKQLANAMTANITGSPGHEYFHIQSFIAFEIPMARQICSFPNANESNPHCHYWYRAHCP
jgi:hypothetical protein